MRKDNKLITNNESKEVKTKEQKAFIRNLKSIQKIKKEIEDIPELKGVFFKEISEKLLPIKKEIFETYKVVIEDFDKKITTFKLSKKELSLAKDVLLDFVDEGLEFRATDEEMDYFKVIHDKHSEQTFDEILEENTNEQLAELKMFLKINGIDISDEELKNLADGKTDITEVILKIQTQMGDNLEKKLEKKKNRKKTAKQIEKEEKEAAAQKVLSKTTKDIYLSLVKNFHPDREPDEKLREEKTKIMQQITVAYNEDDYLKLIELEMKYLGSEENFAERMPDEELKHFNKVLKEQIELLQAEKSMKSAIIGEHGELFTTNKRLFVFNIFIQKGNYENSLNRIKSVLKMIKTEEGFKKLVKQYFN